MTEAPRLVAVEGRSKGGRPTKLTPAVRGVILEALRDGMPRELTAHLVGVARSTLGEWLRSPRFADAVAQAEAEMVHDALEAIRRAAESGTWQAAAWLLERRYPQRFGLNPQRFGLRDRTFETEEETIVLTLPPD